MTEKEQLIRVLASMRTRWATDIMVLQRAGVTIYDIADDYGPEARVLELSADLVHCKMALAALVKELNELDD